ncbi:MAG: hypothetical protein J7L86_04820 [Candidatus Marinimicrobia bacterium]|nr:hypothetical protein [Candidatus Neomarinimicrobiota bacterium]
MKRLYYLIQIFFLIRISGIITIACTTGLAHSSATATGSALLWKNRDSGFRNNEVAFFRKNDISCMGIINADDTTQIWAGVNNYGFAIMNAESKDMAVPGENTQFDDEGVWMKTALLNCKTIDDFENMLIETNETGRKVTSNFGVIDASGNAVFFETGNHEYFRFNSYNPETPQDSWLIRANFADSARSDEGYGKIRYGRAANLFKKAIDHNQLSCEYIISNIARDVHLPDSLLPSNTKTTSLRKTQDTVNRYRTVSSAVFDGCDPRFTTFWCTPGEPVASISIPLWVYSGRVPSVLDSVSGSPLNLKFQEIRRYLYPKDKLIDVSRLKRIQPLLDHGQKQIFRKTQRALKSWRKTNPTPEDVALFQDQMAGIAVKTARKVLRLIKNN